LRKLSCTGYQQEFLFVPSSSKKRKQAELENRSKTISAYQQSVPDDTNNPAPLTWGFHVASRNEETGPLEPRNVPGWRDDVQYILQHYAPVSSFDPAEFNPFHNQICGAWVEALPELCTTKEYDTFFFFAIKTFATSLRCLSPTGKASRSRVLEMYGKSLGLLSEALQAAQGVFQIEHCVAIMCLAVSDMMIPELGFGWATHINGVSDWMESLGPEAFSNGILRTLFVGFRPLLVGSMAYISFLPR
ncbi:hypothetical protein SVAN01_02661, partial [Stagonosporopsis vannaccii]